MSATYEVRGDVAVISLNNPPVNGLGYETRRGIAEGLERAASESGVKALMAGQVVVVPGFPNQITAAWAQVTPRWLTRYVTGFAARRADWLKVD